MSDESRILAELDSELTALQLKTQLIHDAEGRPCLEVYDRYARPRRVYVLLGFYWFVWGDALDERNSVFHAGETAIRLARLALGPGWPPADPPAGLTEALDRYLH